MFYNELFESAIREAREAHSIQLFEWVLREANLRENVTLDDQENIVILETEEDKQKNDVDLKNFYREYAFQQIKNKNWDFVTVENNSSLKIQIVKSGIKEWYNKTTDRRQILCIQALPLMIQKMINIKTEKNDPSKRKRNVEFFLKGECPNISITVDNQEGKYTAHLTIIRRYSEEHRFYCLYLGGLELTKK